MVQGTELAALASAKICHDVMGPITSLVQSLEMLKENDPSGKNSETIQLLDESVQKMWAKLDYFRFAYGGASSEGEGQLSECRETATKLFAHLKPSLVWSAKDVPMPKPAVRVIMNLLVIAADCLPRGGQVEIVSDANEIRIAASGDRAVMKGDVAIALRGDRPEMGYMTQTVPALLTGVFARQNGVELVARESEGRIELIARSARFKAMAA
ncbi:MAG: histidine phosphotransferase family protein [Hyphomonadaceae bacterium]